MLKAMFLLVIIYMVSMVESITIPKREYLELKRKAMAYETEKEEVLLVNKGIAAEMVEIHSGKTKVFTQEQVKKRLGL